jgi:hypothetical protein
MDRREPDEEGTLGKRRAELAPRLRVEDRPPLESVLLGCVVVHGGRTRRAALIAGRTAYPSVGWRFPLEGLARRDHVVSWKRSTPSRQRVPEEERDRLRDSGSDGTSPARRAASKEADGPVWVAEAERGQLLDSVGTDRAAWPSPCCRARRRTGENVLRPLMVGNDQLFGRGICVKQIRRPVLVQSSSTNA